MDRSAEAQRIVSDNRFGDHATVHLGDIYHGHLPHRPETPPQPFASIPFSRDHDFVNRGDILEQIHRQHSIPGDRVALVGLGGVGKSQLAIEFAHRIAEEHGHEWVFWIHAGKQARVEEGFRTIADTVKLAGRSEPGADIPRLVQNWLSNERNGKWTMILDSADEYEVFYGESEAGRSRPLATYLPQSRNGFIVITTRDKDLANRLVGNQHSIIEIGPMAQQDALTLLENKLKSTSAKSVAVDLIAALDFIPLAITQAVAYIKNNEPRSSAQKYLSDLQKGKAATIRLLEHDVGDLRRDGAASSSVLTTWQISFDRIRSKRPSAADLLSLLSYFDRQGIPEWVLKPSRKSCKIQGINLDGTEYSSSECSDSLSDTDIDDTSGFNDDITMLRDYCLVSVNEKGDEFEMHGLVQMSTRRWLRSSGQQERFKQQFIELLAVSFPTGEYENWDVCRELFPHARLAVNHRPDEDQLDNWASLLHNGGWYAWSQGGYDIAERLLSKARKTRAKSLGKESSDAVSSTSMFALVVLDRGRWEEAEKLFVQVMETRKTKLGEDHPDTLTSMANLASTYRNQGRWKEAEKLEVQVMEISKTKLGKNHPDTLTSMNNLASTLCNQGRWEEAEKLFVQVMEISKMKLGQDHPDMLTSMANLASTYRNQGRWEEAEELEVQVMEISKTKLGEDHPSTLTSMANLASTLCNQGRWEEAEKLDVEVMETSKMKLGEDHPDTLTSMANLASTLCNQGRWEEAEKLEVQVMKTRKTKLGEDHPDTLTSMANLASTLWNQGRWEEAEKLEVQVMKTRKTKLGEDHPDTLTSIANLASTYRNQGRWEEAEKLEVQVMEISKTKLGEDHPDMLTSMANLASTYRNQGRWEEAEKLEVQVMETRKTKLGEDHPSTLTSMANLASTLCNQGRWEEAEKLEVQVMEISKKKLGEDHPDTLTSMANLAHTWNDIGKSSDASLLMRECIRLRQFKLGLGHPHTLSSISSLKAWTGRRN